jgi:hypothetical protein
VKVRQLTAVGALLVVALLGFASCGGSGSGVSSAASAQLQFRVAAIRAAAARGDRDAADTQLAQLRADVVRFRADDKVDDSAATRILRAAESVQTELSLLAPASTTTTTTTTTTTEPPKKDKGHGKGRDKGDEGH